MTIRIKRGTCILKKEADIMKRILTLALCLVLLLGVLPLHSLAAENPFVDVKESDWFYDAAIFSFLHNFILSLRKVRNPP